MPKVSDEYKHNKRQQILASAKKCFSENGYQATTIDDIIKDSNISKGTVYNYFKNKEELYLALFHASASNALEKVKVQLSKKESPKEQLSALLQSYKAVDVNNPDWLNMQRVQGEFWSYASRNDELGKLMSSNAKKFVHFIGEIIENGRERGVFRKDIESDVIAEIILSFSDGMISHLLVLQELYPYEEVYELAESLVLEFLATSDSV